MSGTAFAAIGYALAKMGFVTVKLDDDEDEFDERAGKQNYGINMIFFLGFLFSLAIIFTLTVALSRVTIRVRKLAQELALYEHEQQRREEHQ